MNVLIDWGDGLPERANRHIDRVEFIVGEMLIRPLATQNLPAERVLYINPEKVRSMRTVDDQETRGDRLVAILAGHSEEPRDGESAEEFLIRILDERAAQRAARVPVPA